MITLNNLKRALTHFKTLIPTKVSLLINDLEFITLEEVTIGRNYVLGNPTYTSKQPGNGTKYEMSDEFVPLLKAGTTLTFSAYFEAENIQIGSNTHWACDMCFVNTDSTETWCGFTRGVIPGVTNNDGTISIPGKVYSHTITLTKDVLSINLCSIFLRGSTGADKFIIKDYKVEFGDHATPWCPALEDCMNPTLKTINGEPLTGNGDITITASDGGDYVTKTGNEVITNKTFDGATTFINGASTDTSTTKDIAVNYYKSSLTSAAMINTAYIGNLQIPNVANGSVNDANCMKISDNGTQIGAIKSNGIYVGSDTNDGNRLVKLSELSLDNLSDTFESKTFTNASKLVIVNLDSVKLTDGKRIAEIGYDSLPYIKATFNTTSLSLTHNSLTYNKNGIVKVVYLDDLVTSDNLKTINNLQITGTGNITIPITEFTDAQSSALESGITSTKVSTYDGYAATINGKVDKVSGKQLSTNDYTNADKTKVNNIQQFSIGEGLTLDNGALKVDVAHFYTGSSQPGSSVGSEGDLYFVVND